MPTFFAVVAPALPPAISVTISGGVTYDQFKQSLGSYVYYVNKAYLYSANLQQIQGSFFYEKYDSDGNTNGENILSAISPYQSANAIYLDLKEKNIVIDGRDSLSFVMLPNTTLSLKLYTDMIWVGGEFDEKGINPFFDYERNEDTDFFENYDEYL